METVNLEQLTEKIYQEAIEKAEVKADEIISEAKAKSKQIIKDAQVEAKQNILNKAKKEASLLKSTTESELQLQGKRLISDLKREITNLISNQILTKNINDAFLDTSFFKEIIMEVIKNWSDKDVIELRFPENIKNKIEKGFSQEIAARIKNLTITFDNRIKNGFQVSKKNDSYQISFTDADFIAFFSSYLHLKTQEILFDSKK